MRMSIKKLLTVFMALVMIFSSVSVTLAYAPGTVRIEEASLSADVYGLKLGTTGKVTFTADIKGDDALDVSVYDENGNFITTLHKSNDGSYTGSATLYAKERDTMSYHIEIGGKSYGSHDIRFYKPLTQTDLDNNDATWDNIEALQVELQKQNADKREVLNAVYDYLLTDSDVESVWMENDTTINFESASGIGNIFTVEDEEGTKSGSNIAAESTGSVLDGAILDIESVDNAEHNNVCVMEEPENEYYNDDYIGNTNIGVFAPYYDGKDENFTFKYYASALKGAQKLESTITAYYGDGSHSYAGKKFEACGVTAFQNFDKYGIAMVDSHGANYRGGGCIQVPFPGEYSADDLAEGLLYRGGKDAAGHEWVGVQGGYIKKYCPNLPNTIVYVGICHGMESDNLYQPLLDAGAGVCMGYIGLVTFEWDGQMVSSLYNVFLDTNKKTKKLYTAEEAYDRLNELNKGPNDPYGGYNAATFTWKGNGKMRMHAANEALTSASLSPSDVSLYTNNIQQLSINTKPLYANPLICKWSSSDSKVATVDENGVVTAHERGTATITCDITDMSDASAPKDFKAQIDVNSLGIKPVSGIELENDIITIYMGDSNSKIEASVSPSDASDQAVNWKSHDESVVTVSNGVLTPVSVGSAVVTAAANDGGYSQSCIVIVKEGTLDAAANKVNGDLQFTNPEILPWSTDYKDGRFAVKTSSPSDNGATSLTLNAGQLKKDTVLTFDWKVSSEYNCDKLSFTVNNQSVSDIESISGKRGWENVKYTVPSDGNYTFRWTYKKDVLSALWDDCGWLDDIDIISPDVEHTVTFESWDGTQIGTKTAAHGEAVEPPEAVLRENYTFVGWSEDISEIRNDMTVKAMYTDGTLPEVPKFKVTFYDGDMETVLEVIEVTRGGTAEPTKTPTMLPGYKFLGWDGDYTNVQENLSIYPKAGLYGDVNLNNKLDAADATMLLRMIVGLDNISEEGLVLADINGDEKTNTGDVSMILKRIVEAA